MIAPSFTATAPTGTSPSFAASRGSSSAWNMKSTLRHPPGVRLRVSEGLGHVFLSAATLLREGTKPPLEELDMLEADRFAAHELGGERKSVVHAPQLACH